MSVDNKLHTGELQIHTYVKSEKKKVTRYSSYFVMFVGNNFLGQTVSFGICQGVVFSRDKIHCLDPSKQPRALANL